MPTVVHAGAGSGATDSAYPGAARDWTEHHNAGSFSRTLARVLGRLLAALHRLPADCIEDRPPGIDPMWGLSLSEPPHELLLDLSSGAQDLVARLQASSGICARLEELRRRALRGNTRAR